MYKRRIVDKIREGCQKMKQLQTHPKAETETQPKSNPQTHPKAETETQPKSNPQTHPKAETETEATAQVNKTKPSPYLSFKNL
jgi:hypothetical protein